MLRQVGASTPVVSICEVVKITGVFQGLGNYPNVPAQLLVHHSQLGQHNPHEFCSNLHSSYSTPYACPARVPDPHKDNRLVKAIGAFQVLGQMLRNHFRARKQRYQPFEILCAI